jgi:outer membrane biosynthesis protein TonB
MAKKLTKRQLVAAYKELDTVIGVDPPIDYEDLSVEEFARELLETVEELVEPGDKFSDSTQAIFDQLKEEPEEPEDDPEEKEEPDDEPEEDDPEEKEEPDDEPEEDDKEDDEQDDEPEPEEKPRKRSAKPVKEEKAKPEKKEKKEKPEKKEKKERKKKDSGEPSNKAQVYLAWKDGEKDEKKLHAIVSERVQIKTIHSWLSSWEKGKRFPAISKKSD